MHTRLLVILNAGVLVLLLVLTMEAAGMRRSLRRIEREQRRLVTPAPALVWYLVAPPGPLGNVDAPFEQWTLVFDKPFDTEAQCLSSRKVGRTLLFPEPEFYNTRCVSSDDPRLKALAR
jgi:hypothetical protein